MSRVILENSTGHLAVFSGDWHTVIDPRGYVLHSARSTVMLDVPADAVAVCDVEHKELRPWRVYTLQEATRGPLYE